MYEVIVPRLDPAMKTGKIVEWLKKEGDQVRKGEALLVVEGEKTTFEVEAPGEGVLRRILSQSGADVEVPAVVGLVGHPDEPLPTVQVAVTVPGPPPSVKEVKEAPPKIFERRAEEVRASPLARKLAEEHAIDLATIKGTGPEGRILKEDVLRAMEKRTAVAVPVSPPTPTELFKGLRIAKSIPLSGIRRTVAERLSYSFRTTVPVIITMDVDMENLISLRGSMKTTTNTDLSLTAFIVKAVAKALEAHGILNSALEGEEIKIFEEINIALAINTPEGLVAPVIREANKKTVQDISNEIHQLTEKAIEKRLDLADLLGGTFTISNLGPYGVGVFAPVINPPQSAIIGIGATQKRMVIINENIAVRHVATLSLVFDHRIVDGLPAAEFLQDVKKFLEIPHILVA